MDRLDHSLTWELTKQYFERECLTPTSKIVLNLTAIITCLCLVCIYHSLRENSLTKTHSVAYTASFKLALNTSKSQAIEPARAKKTLPETPLKPPKAPRPPVVERTQPPINQSKPLRSTSLTASQPDIAPTITTSTQNNRSPTQPWSHVFDSRLRNKLQLQSSQQLQLESRPEIITYRNLDGSEEVQHNGRCFTVTEYSASPTGKKWSLPHHCKGQLTESEHMARGLKQAMQARFPKNSPPR